MTHRLTTRPNLVHLRGQAKTLLAELRDGKPDAARAFIAHLPKARGMSAAKVRAAEFRLADAQSVIARQNGFPSWSSLVRHVEQLRALEGEWHFDALQVDGAIMPPAMIGASKLLIDGDRFRMASPEANYDGRFTIDASAKPMQIDIEFVEGPEEGNVSYGLFALDGDRLTICLGVVGASRPNSFESRPGSGHALEQLRRASAARPQNVTGGVAQPARPRSVVPDGDPADFAIETSPTLARLEGTWLPTRLVTAGEEMRADWLPYGSRTSAGNETKVVFGGQVMLHARVRIDESATPTAVDYLHLQGRHKGKVSTGIMQWNGDEVCFLIADPGHERPSSLAAAGPGLTFSQWKRAHAG